MKITFVKPNMIQGIPGDSMEPRVFGILSALTPPDIQRCLYDERLEAIPFDDPTELVASTCDIYGAKRAYEIASEYRRRGVQVALGGFHPSLCPDEAGGYADSVIIGDAEDTWPDVIQDARDGMLQPIYRSGFSGFENSVADYRIFDGKRYGPVRVAEYNRGCRFACDFCSIRAMYNGKIRRRSLGELLDEIERSRKHHLVFADDNLYADKASLGELLRGLQSLKVRWSCQISSDVVRDPALVAHMAEAGCVSVTIGIESLDAANLDQMHKSWMGLDLRRVIRSFQEHGILVYGTFVLGYDHDTPEAFDRILEFAMNSNLFLANFNPLVPTPGTPLYDRLKAENRLLYDKWWLDPRYRYGDCVFQPRHMTPEQLRDGCFRLRREFNKARRIMARFPGMPWRRMNPYKAGVFIAANYVSRKEIYRKQGKPLGAVQ